MIFPSTGLNPLKSCFRFNVRLNRFLGPNSSLPCFGAVPLYCGWLEAKSLRVGHNTLYGYELHKL